MRSTAVSVPLSIKIYPVEIISKSVCFSMERHLPDVLSNNQDFFLKLMTETKLHQLHLKFETDCLGIKRLVN
jgi:hypothetical protein